jgi:hypothetical protein
MDLEKIQRLLDLNNELTASYDAAIELLKRIEHDAALCKCPICYPKKWRKDFLEYIKPVLEDMKV